jgi:tetratricopeptide (TPR) repeat protein
MPYAAYIVIRKHSRSPIKPLSDYLPLNLRRIQILTAKGEVYEDMEQWNDAVTQYALALNHAHRLNYWRGITQTAGLLAEAHEKEGKFAAALEDIDQAIAANAETPDELYFSPRNLAIKAKILARMGDVDESNTLYQKSEALIDSLVATAPTPEMERELLTELRKVYSGHFESLCQQDNLAEAFRTVEKAREGSRRKPWNVMNCSCLTTLRQEKNKSLY